MSKVKKELKLLYKFSLVGALNTLVGFAVMFTLMFLGVEPYLSNAACYTISFFLSFFLSKHFVFRVKTSKRRAEVIRFILAFACAFIINLFALKLFLHMTINPYISQLLAGIIYAAVSYVLSRKWVFSPKHSL